ncbi:MAG: GNAT family N-acetyltransferase [Promethearchaeota archaeon]
MDYQPLTQANLKDVYELFKRNELFYSIPLEYFRRGTFGDKDFDPDLTLILADSNTNNVIATLIAVNRAEYCCIKALIVEKVFRRQGIGKKMLQEIINRVKTKNERINYINFGASPPNYWLTGVDVRHTDLLFFLKKNRFKLIETRQNLTVPLKNLDLKPLSDKKEYHYERVQSKDFEELLKFVRDNYSDSSWPEEVLMSLQINPPPTFVAKNKEGQIIGWATHGLQFPGAFGPTGVLYTIQGKGIGSELLKWCLWDIKQSGLETCTIMWVVGNTIKFYSKSIGAYISPVFYQMTKKLRR